MTELVDVRIADDQMIMVFRDGERLIEVSVSTQTGANLIAGLMQTIVDLAPSNAPGVRWLEWPQMARSAEVSFDVEAIDSEMVGIAVKLPGLLPVTLEIPPGSARSVADAMVKAADESERFQSGLQR
jgi:hypothetical protein